MDIQLQTNKQTHQQTNKQTTNHRGKKGNTNRFRTKEILNITQELFGGLWIPL